MSGAEDLLHALRLAPLGKEEAEEFLTCLLGRCAVLTA